MAVVKSLMKARKLAAEMRQLAKKKKPDPVKTRKAYKLFVEGKDKELYPLFVDAKNKVPQGEFLEANFPDVAFTAPNGKMYVPSKGAKRTKGEKPKGTGDPVTIPDEKTRIKLIEEGYITDKVKRTEDAPFGKVTAVAARPGWHSSQMPVATHIGPQDIKINKKEADTLIKSGITPEAIKKRGNQLYVKRRAEDHVYAEVDMADDVDYQSMLTKEGKTDINDRVPVGGSYKYVDGQADSDRWVVGGDMRINRVLSKEETKAIQNELGVKDLPSKKDVENILGKKFYQGGSVTGDTMEQGVDDYILAKTDSNQIKMNRGGVAKQMELFDDGGLKDEGGMIDEVSGNDVPSGSTKEEVRDDIPAQLSEGEFVLPADVVRYHGLEKIMELRDEAKAGLQKMEAMGQMGNSEEATLDDDIPFSIDDLDMEDEPQEMAEGGYVMVEGKPMPVPTIAGQKMEMQVGGMVNAPTVQTANALGTYNVPTSITTQPSYFQNYAQAQGPVQPFVPQRRGLGQAQQPVYGQQTQGPTFNTLMPQLTGERETKEYRNEAGQKLFIPFVGGKPIYPIPEGYTEYKEEKEVTPEKKPIIESTSVRKPTEDGGDSNVLSGTSQVRGTDNSLIDTNFGSQSTEKVRDNFSKMTEAQRGLAVINSIDSAKGSSTFARNLATGMLGVTGGPLGMLAGAYDTGSRLMGGEGLGLGQPQTDAFNNIISTFEQQYEGMSGEERDQDQYSDLNSLSQAVYGLNYEEATSKLGIAPTFKKGFKPGDIDPRTGGTYDIYGQSTNDDGTVSYSDTAAAGRGFSAMMSSGFMGGIKDAQRVSTSLTANAKDKAKANAYLTEVMKDEKTSGLIADKKAKEEEAKRQEALAEAQRKAGEERARKEAEARRRQEEQRRAESQGRVTGREQGMSMGDDGGDDSPSQDSGMGGMGDVGYSTAVGGFIKKPKPKTKKMKRGGLASR